VPVAALNVYPDVTPPDLRGSADRP